MAKDAKGHGSNSKGVAQAAGYKVVRRPPLGHFIQTPQGAEHGPYFAARGAWKDAAGLSRTDAATELAKGNPKASVAPTHDSMTASIERGHAMRSAGDGGHVTGFEMNRKKYPDHSGGVNSKPKKPGGFGR